MYKKLKMKKIYTIITIAALASLWMQGCTEEELTVFPTVITSAISDITEVSATVAGRVTDFGTAAVTEVGICWGVAPNPTIDDNKVAGAKDERGDVSVSITGLRSGTTYFVRAYALCSCMEVVYGDLRSFTTEGQLAMTLPFVERFHGGQFPPQHWYTIDHDGDGHDWYLDAAPFRGANSDSYSGDALEPYNFLVSPKITISGTNPKLEWNVGAYSARYPADHYKVLVSTTKFTNENCESVGQLLFEETLTSEEGETLKNRSVSLSAFSGQDVYIAWVHYDCSDEYCMMVTDIRVGSTEQPVPIAAPQVGQVSVSEVSATSATLSAIITHDGGVSVIGRGFCWGVNPNPTIEDNVEEASLSFSSILTTFSTNIELEPETTYYVRAFAINTFGMTYSSETTITTPPEERTPLLLESFATDPFERGWTEIERDGDGYSWETYSQSITSDSWRSGAGALLPENYLVSPSLALPADARSITLSFQVAAGDDSDYSEQYRVVISEEELTFDNCRDAEILQDWTELGEEHGDETFVGVTLGITAYAGKTVYIGIVHGNCSDQYYILVRNFGVYYLGGG
jgi:hypothetical protein